MKIRYEITSIYLKTPCPHGRKTSINGTQIMVGSGICQTCEYNVKTDRVFHLTIKNALKLLGSGIYGNPEKPEGVVYRVEREGRVDFLAKFVRSDKEDGKYLDTELWNKGYSLPEGRSECSK